LDTSRLVAEFSCVQLPSWQQGLEKVLTELASTTMIR
jgi:hypothetical protein